MNPQLKELHDIHLPPPISWWPLALGWWVLAVVVLMLVFAAGWLYRRRRNAKRLDAWRREALNEIVTLRKQITLLSTQQVLSQLSMLIRRVAITRFPRRDVAALHGDRWLAFLDSSLGDDFRAVGGAHLITAPYQPQSSTAILSAESLQKLVMLVERWIGQLENPTEPSVDHGLKRQSS
jgi:Domain of unknown function (DUF4381)